MKVLQKKLSPTKVEKCYKRYITSKICPKESDAEDEDDVFEEKIRSDD